MSLGSTIQASLGLNIGRFRAGLNDAVTKAGDARKRIAKQLEPIGGGGLIGRLGVVGVVAGFMGVVKAAQRARDEAAAMGKEIDASTAAAARLADTFGAVGEKVQSIAIGAIGILQRGIDELALRTIALFTADNVEELRAYMAENDRAAAKRLAQVEERAKAIREAAEYEKKVLQEKEKAEDRIDSARKKRAEMNETREQKITRLQEERNAAEERMFDAKLSLTEQTEAMAEAEELTNEIMKEQKSLEDDILAVKKEITEVQQERAQEAETSEQKIKRLQQEQVDEMAKANDMRLTELERTNAALRVEQLKSDVLEEQNRTKEQMAAKDEEDKAAQEAKLQTLRQQRDALVAQQSQIEKNIKAQEKQKLLPTLGEVASGERRIGGRAQQAAKNLERARKAEQLAADRVAREKENAQAATTEGAARDAERNRREAQEQLDAATARRKEVEQNLGGKVSDLGNDSEQAQLDELKEIRTAVEATADALAITEAGN
jgi:hypothetical protein